MHGPSVSLQPSSHIQTQVLPWETKNSFIPPALIGDDKPGKRHGVHETVKG
jgi:hypothetical protein